MFPVVNFLFSQERNVNHPAASMLALGILQSSHAAKLPVDAVLTPATVIDVEHGTHIKGKSVIVNGDLIIAVVDDKALAQYAPKKTIKLPGKYLMPGQWDTHMHFGGGPELQGQKVDFVKITENTMSPSIYLEALKQAKARGMRMVVSRGAIYDRARLDQLLADVKAWVAGSR